MKRTQVQLDESVYRLLRRTAFEQGVSVSALIRHILGKHLGTEPMTPRRIEDFTFIGSGYSRESSFDPISERHDEALGEDLAR